MPSDHTPAGTSAAGDIQGRLLVVSLCLLWGITWPVMKIALEAIPPLTMRTLTAGFGAVTLFAVCLVRGRSVRVRTAKAWAHLVIISLFNIVAFSLLSAFAQVAAATSRVAILAYTMPIWTVVFAWLMLGERPTRMQTLAIGLCSVGLMILILPLAAKGAPLGVLMAVGAGVSWAAGTVYVKWARLDADPLGIATWQVTIAFFVIGAGLFLLDRRLELDAAGASALLATVFTGIVGSGVAYAVWFDIVRRLPAATASLSILSSPVVGVVSSVVVLGERPTLADLIGFALIFAASACVVLTSPPSAGEVKDR